MVLIVTYFRIKESARLLGVSDDTVRRWVGDGVLGVSLDASGRQVIAGAQLAARAQALAQATHDDDDHRLSARNRFEGLVTRVETSGLVAQVELQCGPFRVVSLMTSEAAADLGLEVGSRAVAIIKATTVIVESA